MSTDDIIAHVKARPELWQCGNSFYNNRAVRRKKWKDIATELDVDVNIIKKKWKNLKDHYRKELKKIQANNQEDLSDDVASTWKQYLKMSFLKDVVLQGERPKSFWSNVSDSESLESEDDLGTMLKPPQDHTDDDPLNQQSSSRPKKRKNIENTALERTEDSGKVNEDREFITTMADIKQILQGNIRVAGDMAQNDPDYMFLMSILPLIKKMTDIQKLQFRGKVNDLLLQAVMQNEYSANDQCFVQVKTDE